MRTESLLQRSGVAAIIGGLLLPSYQLLHPARDAQTVLSTPYALIHTLGIIALAHLLFGMVGVYAAQANRMGRGGLEAFILSFFGTVLWVGALFVDAFLNPTLATFAPQLQTEGHSSNALDVLGPILGVAALLIPLASIIFIVGTIWFMITTIRADLLPRYAALLIIPGVVLFGAGVFVPVWVETIGGALMGIGYAWLGYRLIVVASQPATAFQPDVQRT